MTGDYRVIVVYGPSITNASQGNFAISNSSLDIVAYFQCRQVQYSESTLQTFIPGESIKSMTYDHNTKLIIRTTTQAI